MQGSGQHNEFELPRQDLILCIEICNPYGPLHTSMPYQHFSKVQQDFPGQNHNKPSDWDPLPLNTSKKLDFNNGLQIRKQDGKAIVTTT